MRLALLNSRQRVAEALPLWGNSLPSVASSADFIYALRRHSPAMRNDSANDANYCAVPAAVAREVTAWTLRDLAAKGVAYSRDAFDCEDFSNALDVNLRMVASCAGLKFAPLCGILIVDQRLPWANVSAGGAHALVAVFTRDEGVLVIEPQNGITCPLESYPNRINIRAIANL